MCSGGYIGSLSVLTLMCVYVCGGREPIWPIHNDFTRSFYIVATDFTTPLAPFLLLLFSIHFSTQTSSLLQSITDFIAVVISYKLQVTTNRSSSTLLLPCCWLMARNFAREIRPGLTSLDVPLPLLLLLLLRGIEDLRKKTNFKVRSREITILNLDA